MNPKRLWPWPSAVLIAKPSVASSAGLNWFKSICVTSCAEAPEATPRTPMNIASSGATQPRFNILRSSLCFTPSSMCILLHQRRELTPRIFV